MANILRFYALCILMICNPAKLQSQSTSLCRSLVSLNAHAANAPENADVARQKSHRGCGQGQVPVCVAALIKGQKLLRDQTFTVSEYVSESRETLTTLGSLYHSLQNQTARRGEQLTRQLYLNKLEIDNVTASIAALHRDSSRFDMELRCAAMSLASNITAEAKSLNASSSEAAPLLLIKALQSRVEKATTESARAINNLNDTLRSFVTASCEELVSPVRQKLSQVESLQQRTACGAGWTANGTSCYYYVSAAMEWEDAVRACFALGATLVEIEDRNEDLFIKDFLRGKDWAWIGLHDRSTEGHWQWISGKSNAYRNWAPGEPNSIGDQDCAAAHGGISHSWNDEPCSVYKIASVCERQIR